MQHRLNSRSAIKLRALFSFASLSTYLRKSFLHRRKKMRTLITPSSETLAVSLQDLQTTLRRAENQFRRACDQIVHMNSKLRSCEGRYKRAKENGMKSFRYPLRLRLAVIEGVRNMYYDFATRKALEVEKLRRILTEAIDHVDVVDCDDSM